MRELDIKHLTAVLRGAASLAASHGVQRLQADILLLAEAVLAGRYDPDAADNPPQQKPSVDRFSVKP